MENREPKLPVDAYMMLLAKICETSGKDRLSSCAAPRHPLFKASSKEKKNRKNEPICGIDPEVSTQCCKEGKTTQKSFTRGRLTYFSSPENR